MAGVMAVLFAVLLALAGATIALKAPGRPFRWRRAAAGTLFVAAGGLCLWVRAGGPLPQPRAVVVAFTDGATAEDLQAVAAALGSWDRVAWLRLTRTPPARQGKPAWQSAAAAARRPGEGAEDYRRRLLEGAVEVAVEADGWFAQALRADREARAAFVPPLPSACYQYTLLFLHDPGEVWSGLSPRGLKLDDAARLADPPTDVFAMEAPSAERPGRLEIDLNQEVLPAGPVGGLGGAKARLRLVGAEPLRRKGAEYRLQAWIDGGPGPGGAGQFELPERYQRLTDPGPDAALPPLELGKMEPFAGTLDEGLHRLHVRLTVPARRDGVASDVTYPATRYFKVEKSGVVIVQPPAGTGELAAASWQAAALGLPPGTNYRPPGSDEELFRNYLERRSGESQGGRTNLSPENVHAFSHEAATDEIVSAAKGCRCLVLVEPTAALLARLDGPLKTEDLIRNGLTVLVVGPPPEPPEGAAAQLPAWLPFAARPVKPGGPDRRQVYRDRRLYFVPDNSRLMRFPTWNRLPNPTASDLTGLSAQAQVINAVCRNLKARDRDPAATSTDLVKVSGDAKGVNRFLSVAGPVRPRRGAVAGADGDVPLTVFPPISHYLAMADPDEITQRPQWLWEAAPSFLPTRLHSLERPPLAIDEFQPLNPDHLYPGSAVVLFVAEMPQPRKLDVVPAAVPPAELLAKFQALTDAGKQPVAALSGAGEDPAALARLARMGVTVYVVRVRLPQGHDKALEDNFRDNQVSFYSAAGYVSEVTSKHPDLSPYVVFNDRLVLDFSDRADAGQAAASVKRVADELTSCLRARSAGDLVRRRGGRVIDDRGAEKGEVPERHLLLEPTRKWRKDDPPGPLEPHHAVITGPKLPPEDGAAELPAVAARPLREGHVVVTAYSPFAADVWRRDVRGVGLPLRAPVIDKRPDGWGVQRLLDAAELTTPRRSVPERHPIVRGVREADDGATLWVDCWGNLSAEGWAMPTLHRPDGTAVGEGSLFAWDRLTRSVTFQFRSDKAERGSDYRLWLDKERDDDEARPRIYLNLLPSSGSGRSVRESLSRLAALSGGDVVSAGSAHEALAFRRPVPWFAGLALVVTAVLLFSPALRPWALLRRWRSGGDPAVGDLRPTAAFDVEAVLVEWGLNPGDPRAARQAGLPGGQKSYEGGDSLAVARPGTLFPFTSTGRLVLPARRPTVRRRHITRAMEAVLLLDCTRSLLVPAGRPNKADYLELLARLIAGAVWGCAGTIRVGSVQDPAATWGPRPAGDHGEELGQFVRDAVARGAAGPWGRLRPPEDLLPGHVLFLASDLLAPREDDLCELLPYCAREGIGLRVAHLVGASDAQMHGLGRSALSGALLDRAEWGEADLAAALRRHAARMRQMVEAEEGRFASVSSDLSAGDVFERLVAQEFFR